jgi:hypothetical protein
MAGQLGIVRIGTNGDGAASTPLGIVPETNGDAVSFADPSFIGSGGAGIVLAGGIAPIAAPAYGTLAPASVGRNEAPVMTASDPVYTGTYLNGIVLTNPATQNPVTVAATGYVTNQTMTYNGDAIYGAPGYSWTVTNLGMIHTNPYNSGGVHLMAGGAVTNGQSDSTGASITGAGSGIVITGGSGTVTNYGAIQSGGYGVLLTAGGTVTNWGSIQGDYPAGVALWGGGTVTNFGTIYGTYWDGVELGPGGSVTNFGTIYGPHAGVAYIGTLGGMVTNAGTISGGSSGQAVLFGGGDDLLVVDPGAVFVGKVDGGGGNNTLELAPGAGPGLLNGLSTSFVNFGSVVFDAGAAWTVTLDNPAAFTGTISGFASGDFIDVTGRGATGVSYSGTAATGASYSGNVLTVFNGPDVVAALNLVGSYSSGDFSLSPDGLGGTDIGIAGPTLTLFGQSVAAGSHAAPVAGGTGADLTYHMTAPEAQDLFVLPHH